MELISESCPMAQAEIDLSPEIQELGIEQYARELDSNGLTIVPPEVNQFGLERIDRIVEIILERAEAMTGSKFTLDDGPLDELEFPRPELTPVVPANESRHQSVRVSLLPTNTKWPQVLALSQSTWDGS